MSRIIVTGNAGFIGFHVTRTLLDAGHDVHGIDAVTDYYDPELKKGRLAILRNYPRFSHDTIRLEHRDAVSRSFRRFDPSVVIHLGAQAGVRYSIENPAEYLDSNVDGTFAVLAAARETRLDHLLIASTSSVYGGNERIPFSERDSTQSPVSLYAATKIAAEALAHSYSHLWEIPTTCFRFFTVYGPWGRPDMALFKFVKAILAGESIDVYGYGRMERDFTYVDDLVSSIVRLIDQPPRIGQTIGSSDTLSAVAPYRIVNVAGGNPVGLDVFIESIERALGEKAQRNLLPMQPGDVVRTFADPTLLGDLIGVVPSTPVEEGVRKFVDWYRSYYG